MEIPAIGVRATDLVGLGIAADGAIEVPQRWDSVGWYENGAWPGQVGSSVLAGHVDSAEAGPAVFFRLGELVPGDTAAVTRADGATAVFTVDSVGRYPKDEFPTASVYGAADGPELRLVTCGGTFDEAIGHYRDNIVVSAHLTAVNGGQ